MKMLKEEQKKHVKSMRKEEKRFTKRKDNLDPKEREREAKLIEKSLKYDRMCKEGILEDEEFLIDFKSKVNDDKEEVYKKSEVDNKVMEGMVEIEDEFGRSIFVKEGSSKHMEHIGSAHRIASRKRKMMLTQDREAILLENEYNVPFALKKRAAVRQQWELTMTTSEKDLLKEVSLETIEQRSKNAISTDNIQQRRREKLSKINEVEGDKDDDNIEEKEKDNHTGLREKKGLSLLSSLIGLTPKVGEIVTAVKEKKEEVKKVEDEVKEVKKVLVSIPETSNSIKISVEKPKEKVDYRNMDWAIAPPTGLYEQPKQQPVTITPLLSHPQNFNNFQGK